jgi:aminoethylphosphonate catabolism LysR family transcriptional regulator
MTTLLNAFHAVCAGGGFTRAAKLLNVSQPTLSQQVKLLEQTYGVRLLERSARGVEPTRLGEELFAITRRLAAAQTEAEELLSGARKLTSGRLAVGADGPYHALPLIRAFEAAHPGPDVTLAVGNSDDILKRLYATQLDIAVVSSAPQDPRLFVCLLRRDPIVAMAPSDGPLARRRSASLAELAKHRLILREAGSVTRREIERALREAGLVLKRPLEVESREAVREAVACGLGIGFVSRAELSPDPRIAALAIDGVRLEMCEYVICLSERRRLGVVRAFLDLAERQAKAAAGANPGMG